jgi:hypothetical protein
MDKHAPEPWKFANYRELNRECGFIVSGNWEITADSVHPDNATRIVECVNAMTGIESPLKLRETWDAVKHLELDAYHKAAERIEKLEAALRQIQADTSELHPAIANIAAKALEGGNDENS